MEPIIEPITFKEVVIDSNYGQRTQFNISHGEQQIDSIRQNDIHMYDFGKKDQYKERPAIYHIVAHVLKNGYSGYLSGCSGWLKKYFYYPCVMSYAITPWGIVAIIKTKRNLYKGVQFIEREYHSFIEEVDLDRALNRIEAIKMGKNNFKELPEEDYKRIIAKKI